MEKGLESFKASVMKDCQDGEKCFSENGCTKERYVHLPQDNKKLIEMGFKTKYVAQTKCFHDYCAKYKWVIERANHYAEKTGKTVDEVMKIWETDRRYWYMNYYQECNQPLLNSESIINYEDWISELKSRFGEDSKKWAFKCPNCGNVQTVQDFVDNGLEEYKDYVYFNCIGRYIKDKGCDWTMGGLLKINKVSVMKDAKIFHVFEMVDGILK
jgi:hypothetical protein